jgi:hypothetical protein
VTESLKTIRRLRSDQIRLECFHYIGRHACGFDQKLSNVSIIGVDSIQSRVHGVGRGLKQNAGLDAEFFADTQVKSNFCCNLGYGDASHCPIARRVLSSIGRYRSLRMPQWSATSCRCPRQAARQRAKHLSIGEWFIVRKTRLDGKVDRGVVSAAPGR